MAIDLSYQICDINSRRRMNAVFGDRCLSSLAQPHCLFSRRVAWQAHRQI